MNSPSEELKLRQEWNEKIAAMTEAELFLACKEYIWLSAYANNNPRSNFHWKCDATYDECKRRNKSEIYSKAHTEVSKQ